MEGVCKRPTQWIHALTRVTPYISVVQKLMLMNAFSNLSLAIAHL